MKKPKGYVLYEGPSKLEPTINIIVVAVMGSGNSKTGDMVQIYYMVQDIYPQSASELRMDSAVCGDCPHRQCTGGACYVVLFHGPRVVYDAYKRGVYSYDTEEFYSRIADRMVRLGAYGDPASAPTSLAARICAAAKGHTGYTHQRAHASFDDEILEYCMESVDTEGEYLATDRRTFRVKAEGEPILAGEVYCPSERVSCRDCGLCRGGSTGRSVVIDVHGSRAARLAA